METKEQEKKTQSKDHSYPGVKEKCIFYFTGSTIDHLFKGISVELYLSMNPNECQNELQQILLANNVDLTDKQLLIYLPGGIPFISGTLREIYSNEYFKAKKIIYGIITRHIKDSLLNEPYLNICNINNSDSKKLISPLCDSSDLGLSDMACLLGYLRFNGLRSEHFQNTISMAIPFAPLITSTRSIIDGMQVSGREIVTFCSTLFTFFRGKLPLTISDDRVFEYALRICNLIAKFTKPEENLPILNLDFIIGKKDVEFLQILNIGPFVYFWKNDLIDGYSPESDFTKSFEDIQNGYEINEHFTPINPRSIRFRTTCEIVRGKTHEFLFVAQSPLKSSTDQSNAEIIDPFNGMIEIRDIEEFAREQETAANQNVDNYLFDQKNAEQFIMINLDTSKSMLNDINGNFITPKSKPELSGDHRITIAIQYLTIFLNKINDYYISSVNGLVSFNDSIELRCPLCSLACDIETKRLMNINPKSKPKLWDSIIYSCNEIVKFKEKYFHPDKNEYCDSKSRILVISSGEDDESDAKFEDVVKELFKNKIIVDSIILNSGESQNDDEKMLCALCHTTGGLSFKINDFNEGLSIFENDAFINILKRNILLGNPLIKGDRKTMLRLIKVEQITAEFMQKVANNSEFDSEIINIRDLHAKSNNRLMTPRSIFALNRNSIVESKYQRRIMRELFLAMQINDPKSIYFDPDIKIFTMYANLDIWIVFLKTQKDSLYGEKWWYLYVTFPKIYPVKPPHFKFISVPYHVNVSFDGVVNNKAIDKVYSLSDHVVDMIWKIKELFLVPNLESPNALSIYDTYISNRSMYEKLARDSANSHAKDNYTELIKNAVVNDEESPDFNIFYDKIPSFLAPVRRVSRNMDDMVLASSGVYYYKKELKDLVTNCNPPICVVTGKVLTEKPEDFDNI